MIYSILYFALAALGLGILVFIHELGHYFIARREGMKIEAFSIGFGKPLLVWEKDGVKWQICWIPLGGYVRIAGMDKQGSLEPHQIEGGFYSKKPLARIKVAIAGPLVNIVFAFLLFCVIWALGGRDKPFSNYTRLIGWVDAKSDLQKIGVSSGDEIVTFNNKPFEGATQLFYSSFLDNQSQSITGYEIDYWANRKTPFTYTLDQKEEVQGKVKPASLLSILGPAGYLIYKPDLVTMSSPMKDSGIESGDRILWVDGELVFSRVQLSSLVNQPRALLTVKRGDSIFLTRIPRLQIGDLRLQSKEKTEMQDFAYANELKESLAHLYFIPYLLTSKGEVEKPVAYINEEASETSKFQGVSKTEIALEPGDKILAVDGKEVSGGSDILLALQTRHIQVVVQRGQDYSPILWNQADKEIMEGVSFKDLETIVKSIGSSSSVNSIGNLVLLKPVEPRPFSSFSFADSVKEKLESSVAMQKKQIEEIKNPKERARAARLFEQEQNKLLLGGVFEDRVVKYNPSPVFMFGHVFDEMWRTLTALFTGYVSPKNMAGPVGIIQVMQQGWGLGIKEAFYWMALISINLGFVNLLPIPVLDGGHICFALYEIITGKRIKAKVMEKLILPFVFLIIAFFIYATYHDLIRIFFPSW